MTNRDKHAALLQRANITRADAARYIAEETKRPCSWRAVQSWLADPALPSARECPDWVAMNLTVKLKRLKLIA